MSRPYGIRAAQGQFADQQVERDEVGQGRAGNRAAVQDRQTPAEGRKHQGNAVQHGNRHQPARRRPGQCQGRQHDRHRDQGHDRSGQMIGRQLLVPPAAAHHRQSTGQDRDGRHRKQNRKLLEHDRHVPWRDGLARRRHHGLRRQDAQGHDRREGRDAQQREEETDLRVGPKGSPLAAGRGAGGEGRSQSWEKRGSSRSLRQRAPRAARPCRPSARRTDWHGPVARPAATAIESPRTAANASHWPSGTRIRTAWRHQEAKIASETSSLIQGVQSSFRPSPCSPWQRNSRAPRAWQSPARPGWSIPASNDDGHRARRRRRPTKSIRR